MQKREYKVLAPIPKTGGGEWWMTVGRGYDNVDGSMNIYLDAIPAGTTGKGLKLQLRALDAEDLRRREAYRANAQANGRGSTATVQPTAPTTAPAQDAIPF